MGTVTVHRGPQQSASPGLALLRGLGSTLVDLLFPPHCAACHSPGAWLCPACRNEIELIVPPVCPRCGWPLHDPLPRDARTCSRCRQSPTRLACLRSCAFYSGPLRRAIRAFKYDDLQVLASHLGELMAEGWRILDPSGWGIDVVVPVPLHNARLKERGYDQAALLARAFGARLQQQVVEGVLVRTRATAPQVGLTASERQANVHNAFQCTNSGLKGHQVLLVDDVCTTGATLEAAAAALLDDGASSVWAYTLARAR